MNPQAYNRYSYVYNSPLNLIDPSGHDPLDEQWFDSFREQYGREPDEFDRVIRLFSIAFPDEWDESKFYDNGGWLKYDEWEKIFKYAPDSRTWANLQDALERLATYYTWNESEEFARDIGTLFAGLPDRFDSSINEAVTGCQEGFFCGDERGPLPHKAWVHIQNFGMPSYLIRFEKSIRLEGLIQTLQLTFI